MSVITVSADYFGKAIYKVQREDKIPVVKLSHLFGCDTKQLHRYIYGADLIPQDVLRRIIKYAVMTDAMIEPEK